APPSRRPRDRARDVHFLWTRPTRLVPGEFETRAVTGIKLELRKRCVVLAERLDVRAQTQRLGPRDHRHGAVDTANPWDHRSVFETHAKRAAHSDASPHTLHVPDESPGISTDECIHDADGSVRRVMCRLEDETPGLVLAFRSHRVTEGCERPVTVLFAAEKLCEERRRVETRVP